MLHPFLEFGGLIFWILLGVVALTLSAQVNEEKFRLASITLIIALAAIIAFTTTPVVATVIAHPVYVLYGLLAYLGVAGLWAMVKWRLFFLPNLFDEYADLRNQFLKSKGLKEMPADPNVQDQFKSDYRVKDLNINYYRMISNNKQRVTAWMVFWPFSIAGTFVGDFLHRVFTTIYKALAGLLQRMSDGMASRYNELN